ncbi:hypothetical protein JZ751_013684, partial [Albula glossodonta]
MQNEQAADEELEYSSPACYFQSQLCAGPTVPTSSVSSGRNREDQASSEMLAEHAGKLTGGCDAAGEGSNDSWRNGTESINRKDRTISTNPAFLSDGRG